MSLYLVTWFTFVRLVTEDYEKAVAYAEELAKEEGFVSVQKNCWADADIIAGQTAPIVVSCRTLEEKQ